MACPCCQNRSPPDRTNLHTIEPPNPVAHIRCLFDAEIRLPSGKLNSPENLQNPLDKPKNRGKLQAG